MNQKVVGSFLKELRKEKGITQEQFAEIMEVSARTVSRWETGSNMPDLEVLILIADYYGVELREILDGERKREQAEEEIEDGEKKREQAEEEIEDGERISRQIDIEGEETVWNSSGAEEKKRIKKMLCQLSWVGVIILIILGIFYIISLIDNKKTKEINVSGEETALPEKTEYTKNASDVEILMGIIEQQISLGASVSKKLDSSYIWDNNGRLIRIYWNDKRLRGEISLAGLDALEDFTCCNYSRNPENYNRITGLDISDNPALKNLLFGDSEITSIDLSKAPNLESISLPRNSLTTVDVSQNLKLSHLAVTQNNISVLDISKNSELKSLYCEKNNISALDISKNQKLEILYCQENHISTLNISNNPNLKTLQCSRTVQITGVGASIIDNHYD